MNAGNRGMKGGGTDMSMEDMVERQGRVEGIRRKERANEERDCGSSELWQDRRKTTTLCRENIFQKGNLACR